MRKFLFLVFFLFAISCGGTTSESSEGENIEADSSSTETKNTEISESISEETEIDNSSSQEISQNKSIEEVLREFPNGIISFLSEKEQECLNQNTPLSMMRQIELDLVEGRPFTQEAQAYFEECNIPPPPSPGDQSSSNQMTPGTNNSEALEEKAALVDINDMKIIGVSPHMEVVDETTLRLFYSSMEAGGLAVDLCDYDLNCTRQGAVERIQDLTIVETVDGIRRGYFVELNPNTKSKEIMTAVFSEDGLSYSNKISLGISDGGSMAWGVPDAVIIPDGRVRIYWVDEASGMAGEKILSTTSKTTQGIDFVKDDGYRFENGYVDFEVLKAEENDWEAVFSFSPERLPKTPQSIFYGTSKDGLYWEFTGIPISPLDMSYLDPTGVLLENGDYLIVSAVAPNEMGDREYILYKTILKTP